MGITVPGTTRAPSGMALVALCLLAGGNPIMADEFRPELCAFELASDQLVAGESLPATYDFVNTGGACASEQTVFVHIRPAAMRPADVPPAAGGDFKPALPSYAWPTGAVVRETGRPLGVPADFPPGRYDIYVGMWDPCGGDRTEFGNPDIAAPGRRYLVATVDVLAPGSTAAGEPIRNRWHETTGLPTAWEAMRSSEPPSSVTLPGEGGGGGAGCYAAEGRAL